MTDPIFGELISCYTRAQAIEDGGQFDVSTDPGAKVYKTAVYVTAALHAELKRGQGKAAGTYSARLWDVCYLLATFARDRSDGGRECDVKVGRRRLHVRGECGPIDIDDARPAITLGFPSDF